MNKTLAAFVILLLFSQGAVAVHQIDGIDRSLTGSPEIVSLGFQVTPAWRLSFAARFANPCLAESGITARFVDVNRSHSRSHQTRILLVAALPTRDGCPDIFQPVVRRFVAEMPADTEVKQLVVMNYTGRKPAADLTYQTYAFDPTTHETRDATTFDGEVIKAEPMFGADSLPPVSRVQVDQLSRRRGDALPSYRTQFDVEFPSACHARAGVVAHVLESRTGISDRTGQPVIDWLFVVNRGGAICSTSPNAPVKGRYFLEREASPSYRRRLVVINNVVDETANLFNKFRSYDIR